jgi:hypothetical protein
MGRTVTAPESIGALRLPRPWRSEADWRRLECVDLETMTPAELEAEQRRVVTAMGLASDAVLAEPLTAAPPVTVEQWLSKRLSAVSRLRWTARGET